MLKKLQHVHIICSNFAKMFEDMLRIFDFHQVLVHVVLRIDDVKHHFFPNAGHHCLYNLKVGVTQHE